MTSYSLHALRSLQDIPRVDIHPSIFPTPSSSQQLADTDDFPEGGYGWIIIASCHIFTHVFFPGSTVRPYADIFPSTSFFYVGLPYSWGVIQAQLAKDDLGPTSTLAFIGSLAISFISLGAIVNTHIIRMLGMRKAGILASVLLSAGQFVSSWATNSIGGLFVTNGLITGFGIGLSFMVRRPFTHLRLMLTSALPLKICGTLPAQYFRRRRGLANGLVIGGGGIGGCILSISMNTLISHVGVAWTFRIIAFITLATTLPAAVVLKERTLRHTATVEWCGLLFTSSFCMTLHWHRYLFRDPKFVLLFIGSGIASFPLLVPPFFIPLYASSLGISAGIGSLLLASFNLSSAFGRVGFGYLCDIIGPISSLCLALTVSALSMLAIWPVSTSLAPLVIFIIISGAGNGGFFSTMPSVVTHMYGNSRVASALAMIVSAWTGGYVLVCSRTRFGSHIMTLRSQGAPIAGWILERYGGSEAGRAAFRPAMYYAGSMSLGSVAFVLVIRSLSTRKFLSFA